MMKIYLKSPNKTQTKPKQTKQTQTPNKPQTTTVGPDAHRNGWFMGTVVGVFFGCTILGLILGVLVNRFVCKECGPASSSSRSAAGASSASAAPSDPATQYRQMIND